jgi:hypothetical protein
VRAIFGGYARLLRPSRTRIVAIVVVAAFVGVFEASALLTPAPLINLAGGSSSTQVATSEAITKPLEWVGLEPTLGALMAIFARLASLAATLNYVNYEIAYRLVGAVETTMRDRTFTTITRME